ncbi:MAG: hypothetical protein P1S46_04810 [bacterium]|nr:hypothetical protein [bacterium]
MPLRPEKILRTTILLCAGLVMVCLPCGCERTVEEEVIRPIERMYDQKDAAALEAAVSNVRQVRAALMRYPVTSADNEYPNDAQVYSYDTLREVLAPESLPPGRWFLRFAAKVS